MELQTRQAIAVRTNRATPELRRVGVVVLFFYLVVTMAVGFGASFTYSQIPLVQEPSKSAASEESEKLVGELDEDTSLLGAADSGVDVSAERGDQWQPLLDERLTKWEVFTGVPHKSVTIKGFPRSQSHDCRKGKPFVLGDPKNIYSVTITDGAPVLRVSGEIYAGLTSLEEFENYHFSTEFKWGEKKWPPRKKMKRDSGILLHCNGRHGAFWNAWMRCFQCQIQEGDCGDFIQLGGTSCQVKVAHESRSGGTPQHSPAGVWQTIGPGVRKWGAKRHGNHEVPQAWNQIEVYAMGDKAVFAVNGHPVMHLKDMRIGKFEAGKRLTRGKIQVQSEAAECWYRDMKIRPIRKLPAELAAHFEDH
jgi:hypothetical protein